MFVFSLAAPSERVKMYILIFFKIRNFSALAGDLYSVNAFQLSLILLYFQRPYFSRDRKTAGVADEWLRRLRQSVGPVL